jgi:putative phosphoribosyl transferase
MINFPDPDNSEIAGADRNPPVRAYPDLASAGRELALQLELYRDTDNLVVLGLVLGGIPLANEVASHLRAPLDLVIIRRLLAPKGPGSELCAVSVGGSMIVDEELRPVAAPSTPLEHFLNDALTELNNRERICRRQRPPIQLAGKTVIIVDCGIRTGSTMLATIRALRTMGPARVIAAVPVASMGGHAAVFAEADELVCLAQPRPFGNVGLWYKDFTRPGDDRVGEFVRSE